MKLKCVFTMVLPILIFFGALSANAASVIEGRLDKKIHGDLGPKLGWGCLDIATFFDPIKNAQVTLAILESRSDIQNCLYASDFEGEEFDIDFNKLKPIKSKKMIKSIQSLDSNPQYFYRVL